MPNTAELSRQRRLTAPGRLLPDYLIIGAPKGGTTSLHKYLARHPNVVPPTRKEIYFFTTHYDLGTGWYRAHFPAATTALKRSIATGHRLRTGEASPAYLAHPLAPARVAETLPHVRLITLLRDPAKRAYSHYCHRQREGRPQDATFERYVARSLRQHTQGRLDPRNHVARGHYADQIEQWLAHIPRQRLLVLQSEQFYRDTEACYQRVLEFLSLTPHKLPKYKPHNTGGGYDPPDPDTMARLREHYRPHNERLFELIGERFDWDD